MGRSRVVVSPKLRKALRSLPDLVEQEIKPEMEEGGELILADMRLGLPRDSGKGSDALEFKVERGGLRVRIGLLTKRARRKAFHLRFIEFGTKGLTGEMRSDGRKRRDSLKSDGTNFFGKYPDLPARRATPFMQPAFDINREHLLQKLRESQRRAIARARQS